MLRLNFLDAAKEDIAAITLSIAQISKNPTIAENYTEKLLNQCRHLASLKGLLGRARPELGDGLRSFPFEHYVIFFRYQPECFEVVNVLHGGRDIGAYFAPA
jgi:toxin ParE1/3/4